MVRELLGHPDLVNSLKIKQIKTEKYNLGIKRNV